MKPSAAVCYDACVSVLAVPWSPEITELGEDGEAERVLDEWGRGLAVHERMDVRSNLYICASKERKKQIWLGLKMMKAQGQLWFPTPF